MRQLSTATSLLWGALLLAIPLAAASAAHGQLTVTGAATLPGAATLTAPSGQLTWAAPSGVPTLALHAADVTVRLYGQETQHQQTPIGGVGGSASEKPGDPQSYGSGAVSLEAGKGAQSMVLRTTGPLSADVHDGTLRAVSAAFLGAAKASDMGGAGPCPDPVRCFDAWGVYALEASSTQGALEGDITLLLYGPTLVIGDKRVETGLSESTSGTTVTSRDVYAVAILKGAAGTLKATTPTTWYAATPTIASSALLADAAAGALDVGAKSYHASDETLDVAGALSLAPSPVPPGTSWGKENAVVAPQYAKSFGLQMSGDVQRINLRAAPLFSEAPSQAVGIAAALAVLGGAAAYYWPQLSFGAASLYTRLKQPELLDNTVRNGIYEIIRTNPGISARAVHRSSAQSWGTVVYHLRQLERHHLVVSRSVGRTRNYYENHGKYKGMEIQLACLQSPRARMLARLVLTQPGIVQEELSAGSGFPQPTTSYYVRKLKAAGLVEERREGRYARYHPVGDLGRFLQIAEASTTPTVGALADAAVDA